MMSTCSPPEGEEDNRFKISTENRDYRRLFLGRRFKSDVIIFRIVWPKNAEMISFDNEENLQTGRIAATTLARALVRSFTEGGISGISVQSSDIGADVRMFVDGEDQGWDVFIYETVDGGIGLLEAIFGRIMSSIEEGMEAKDLPGLNYAFEILQGRDVQLKSQMSMATSTASTPGHVIQFVMDVYLISAPNICVIALTER